MARKRTATTRAKAVTVKDLKPAKGGKVTGGRDKGGKDQLDYAPPKR